MSLENCFHVSTVANSRSGVVQYYSQHPFSTKEKLCMPKCKSPRHHPSLSSIRRSPTSRIVCKAREAVDEVQVATETNWDNTVLASERPVLVEFWAPWCGPCRMIAPVVDELAKEYAGKVLCYKLNTDDCPNIATKYGIRSIPTVLFFKNGERKESIIGAVPKSTLTTTIDKYLET